MGRRDIIVSGLYAVLALSGAALVAGYSMTPNEATPVLVGVGWAAMFVAVGGLGYMFRTAPKAVLGAAQEMVTGREFLPPDITPAVLRRKVENRTSVQIDALTKTYAGKWMAVEGRVREISNVSGSSSDRWLLMISQGSGTFDAVCVIFKKPWLEQLAALNKGDGVSVVGRISSLHHGPTLEDGEIVHIGEPPEKAKPAPKRRAPRKAPVASA